MKKLKRSDPGFYAAIGKKGGEARKASGADYSALAAASHPRAEYHGGRPSRASKMQVKPGKKK